VRDNSEDCKKNTCVIILGLFEKKFVDFVESFGDLCGDFRRFSDDF